MSLQAEDVAEYLKNNPEFFELYSENLAEIYLPHPHGGRAISISERQQIAMRDKNKLLETKLRELIQFGEENDAISDKLHRFSVALMAARSLNAVLDTIYFNMREDFDIPHTALRLWVGEPEDAARCEFTGVGIDLCAFVDELPGPQCGQQNVYEIPQWFGEAGELLRSFAYIPLRKEQAFGLLVLASEDAQRFYPEMGTLYLQRLGDLVGAALMRYLN